MGFFDGAQPVQQFELLQCGQPDCRFDRIAMQDVTDFGAFQKAHDQDDGLGPGKLPEGGGGLPKQLIGLGCQINCSGGQYQAALAFFRMSCS